MFSKKIQFHLCIGILIISLSYDSNGIWNCPSCKDWFNKEDSGKPATTTIIPGKPITTKIPGQQTTTLTPGPAGCKRGNESCSDHSECCEICTKEKLCSCLPLQANCGVDGQCCSGMCCAKQTGPRMKQCREFPCNCFEGNDRCASGTECCSNKCEGGRCACKLHGDSCQANSECCSLLCNGNTSKCQRDCKPSGGICTLASECCDGACILRKCIKCMSVGSSCGLTNQACCGSCNSSDICGLSRASRISLPGEPCNIKSDCNHRADCESNGLCGLGNTVGDSCRSDKPCFPNGLEQCNSSTGVCELKI